MDAKAQPLICNTNAKLTELDLVLLASMFLIQVNNNNYYFGNEYLTDSPDHILGCHSLWPHCIHVVIVILLHGQAAVLGGATQATGFFKSFF